MMTFTKNLKKTMIMGDMGVRATEEIIEEIKAEGQGKQS